MHKIYSEDPLPLKRRLRKPLSILGINIFVSLVFVLLQSTSYTLHKYLYVLAGLLVFQFILGLIYITQTTLRYYHEVEIDGEYIIFRGQHINKSISYKFKIKDVNVQLRIRNPRASKSNYKYYLEFTSGKKYKFSFNRHLNWDQQALLDLFNDFKIAKDEHITWDEKYLLNEL